MWYKLLWNYNSIMFSNARLLQNSGQNCASFLKKKKQTSTIPVEDAKEAESGHSVYQKQ